MTSSGGKRTRSALRWPGWPPLGWPRGLRGGAVWAWGGSADGGREELADVWLRRASRSATRASRPVTTAAMAGRRVGGIASHRSAGMDGGRVMSEDGRGRPKGSRPTRRGVNGYSVQITSYLVPAEVLTQCLTTPKLVHRGSNLYPCDT